MSRDESPLPLPQQKIPIIVACVQIDPANETDAYAAAVHSAFRDTEITGFGPTGGLPLLDVSEVRHFRQASREGFAELVESAGFRRLRRACERLYIVVIDATGQSQNSTPKPYRLIPTKEEEHLWIKVVSLFVSPKPLFEEQSIQNRRSGYLRLGLGDLDERDLRMPFFVLHLLRAAAELLQAGRPGARKPRLFFSHAKRDGVPLARGAKMWLRRLPGFRGYYDTDDLDLDKDWRKQLSRAVSRSILVVFRTEVFDQRYWCRQEVLWADEHRRPLVCVDARWQLHHESSLISFDASPAVRIPDGSILRILMAALREAFRVAVFVHRVSLIAGRYGVTATAIPRTPSLVSLASAVRGLKRTRRPSASSHRHYIVYPNPSVPNEVRQALADLVEHPPAARQVRVLSFDEWGLELTSP